MKYIIVALAALWVISSQAHTINQNGKQSQHKDTIAMKAQIAPLSFEDGYTPQPPSVVPPSPQASIFNKYLNHEISDYNGLPQIEIPLYEIEIKGLKIPITLSYHAGGIKYLQYDGDIGAGWSINAGGYGITRTIRGHDDSWARFYNEQDFQQYMGLNQGMKGYIGYNAALSMDGSGGFFGHCMGNIDFVDGEYDQFNYITPGGSGQFIIAGRDHINTRNVVNTNPENKIQLAGTTGLSLSDMKVVDGNGFIYHMGKHPVRNDVYEEGKLRQYNNRTGWPLRQIQSPFNETIEFSYVSHDVSHDKVDVFWDDYYTFNVSEAANDAGTNETTYASYNFNDTYYNAYGALYKTYFISEIRTDKEIVEFVRYTAQPGMPYVVKEIRIKTLSGNPVKTIVLDYENGGIHRLLSKLTIADQVYNFDYYPLPDPSVSVSRLYSDVWGYYKVSETPASWLNFLDERYKDDQIQYQYNSVYSSPRVTKKLKDISEWQGMITWVNRESNGATTHAFSLKKITFPTGGTTEYVYEPNQYRDSHQSGNPIITGAGQRIQKIISRPDIHAKAITTVFKYGEQENGYTDIVDFNWGAAIHNYADKMSTTTAYTVDIPGVIIKPTAIRYQTLRTYSSRRPLKTDADSNPPIVYGQVARYQYNEEGNLLNKNGKTVSYYTASRETPYSTAERTFNGVKYGYVNHYYLGKRAMPDSICIFNSNNHPTKKDVFTYASGNGYGVEYNGVRAIQRASINDDSQQRNIYQSPDSYVNKSAFEQLRNKTSVAKRLLDRKTTMLYDGSDPVITTESYQYNMRNQLTKTMQNNSVSGSLVKEFTYPDSYAGAVYTEMVNRNMIHPVIEKITVNNNVEVGRIKNLYTKDASRTQGLIMPDATLSSASGTSNLRTDITFDLYDARGNLRQYTTLDGKKSTILWSYNGQYPIAEIQNAAYSQVEAAANALGLNLNTLLNSNAPDMAKVNALRSRLNNAFITTFTYVPLVGVASTTDPSEKVTCYEYDAQNRLKETYILNNGVKEVTAAYRYNYINQ